MPGARRCARPHVPDGRSVRPFVQRPSHTLNHDKPDFKLMQQLFDAGIGTCPLSGMPIFDPSKCTPKLRTALWHAYCSVAKTVNTEKIGQTNDALDELRARLCEHDHGGRARGAQTAQPSVSA